MGNKSFYLTAQTYGKLYGVDVRVQGTVAYTNGKIITIPRLTQDAVGERLAYGYIAHEAGHARYTDFACIQRITKSAKQDLGYNTAELLQEMINIFEDQRIEKLMRRLFIGVSENLELLNTHDMRKQWKNIITVIDTENPMALARQAIFMHAQYITFRFAAMSPYVDKVTDAFKNRVPTGKQILDLISDKLPMCEHTLDVCKLALEVVKLLAQDKPNNKNQKVTQGAGNSDDKGKDSSNNGNNGNNGDDSKSKSGGNKSIPALNLKIQSEGDAKKLNEKLKDLYNDGCPADKGFASGVQNIASAVEAFDDVGGSSRDDYGNLASEEASPGRADYSVGRSYGLMNALRLKLKAKTTARTRDAVTGRGINIRKAIRVPCGEENIFRQNEEVDEINTYVQVLTDLSSSMFASMKNATMDSRCEVACRASLMIVEALSGIDNVDRGCIMFPGCAAETCIVCKRSDRLTQAVKSRFDQRPRGSTPLAQAVTKSMESMKFSERDRNILIIISDGMPDSVKNTEAAINVCRQNGVEVYALYISDVAEQYASRLFGKNYKVVTTADELEQSAISLVNSLF